MTYFFYYDIFVFGDKMDVTAENEEQLGKAMDRSDLAKKLSVKIKYLILLICKEKLGKYLYNVIYKNIPEEKKNDKLYVRRLVYELLLYKYYYGFKYEEYFLFDFENKTFEERMQFVGNYERHFTFKKIGDKNIKHIFYDKYLTYQIFEPFYKRKAIKVGKEDFKDFCNFINEYKRIIAKPLCTSQGAGIRFVDCSDNKTLQKEFDSMFLVSDYYILEEIVHQGEKMAAFHPQSINTVRFVTYYNGKDTRYLYAVVRIGVGESIVDNLSAGGIAAAVDLKTGKLITDAYRKITDYKEVFEVHPETGVRIKGSQLPDWNELLSIVDKTVTVVPEQKIVGWDFAYSDKGWVLIEANTSPYFSIQVCGIGIRKQFEYIKNDSFR